MVSLLKRLTIKDNHVIVKNQLHVGNYDYNYSFDNHNYNYM